MGWGSFTKPFKAVTKPFKKAIKKVTKSIKKIGKVVGGDILDDALGLDSLGGAVEDAFKDLGQVVDVATGGYHNDAKKIQEQKDRIDAKTSEYNKGLDKLTEEMDSLIAFDEIFQLAIGNKVDKYVETYNPVLQEMMQEYKALVAKLKSEYDFVIGLTEGSFPERIVGSIIMIHGGIMSDMGDIISGEANGDTWKRVITTTLTVLAVVALFLIPGLQGVALAVAVTLASVAAFMALDGMYANGAATGAIMGMLDAVFNDLLNLDDLIGSDFDKFDKDNEDYAEMVMYTKIGLSLASMATVITAPAGVAGAGINAGTAGTYGTSIGSEQTAMLAAQDSGFVTNTTSSLGGALKIGDSMATSSMMGVSFSTYSDIYRAYTAAESIGDMAGANKQYEDLKNKLESDSAKIQDALDSKYRKSFMKHYKDTAYFLQDQQEHIDRYLWSMTAENMYVDPYGTTPVANSRFTPDKDTRVMSFGYEDMFDDSKMAGSKDYFNNIIYG